MTEKILYHLALIAVSLVLLIAMLTAVALVTGVIAYVLVTTGLEWLALALVLVALYASTYLHLMRFLKVNKEQRKKPNDRN